MSSKAFLPPPYLQPGDSSSQRLFLLRLAKPVFLVQFYTINSDFFLYVSKPPPCSTVCNNATVLSNSELPGCCSFSIRERRHPIPSFLCVFFFSSDLSLKQWIHHDSLCASMYIVFQFFYFNANQ